MPITAVPSYVWLIDMRGWFVHQWKLPGWGRQHSQLLPNGNLLSAILNLENPQFLDPSVVEEVLELDWDGNKVWSYREPHMNSHDRGRMMNGNTLIEKDVKISKELGDQIKGGVPGSELKGDIYSGILQEITPDGKVVWEWSAYEHLDPEIDTFGVASPRHLWGAFNSIDEFPDGNIVACSPNISNLYIIDKATGDIKWRWGKGIISCPHDPTMLDNGNILVLDNGAQRPNRRPPDRSRVIEVNPATNEIEWEYHAENPADFYTAYIGGCQRLPNGNTLICEGAMGRFFEVTRSGEMVWEYVVPFYAYDPISPQQAGLSNKTFRCLRYGPDYLGLQGKKLDLDKLQLWNRLYGPDAFKK